MTDDQLRQGLAALGVSADAWRAVVLLPLVQVAWADGTVQPPERARILEIAHQHGLLDGPAGPVIRGWLAERPTDPVLQTGRTVLAALANRHHGPGADLSDDWLEDLTRQCGEVARAAGGVFDLAFTLDAREKKAIAEIAAALRDESDRNRDDLPDPDGGSFRDL